MKRGPKSTVDMPKLAELVDDGISNAEIAKYFNVSQPRISQKKKDLPEWRRQQKLKVATTPNTIQGKSIAILDQIIELNEVAKRIHDDLGSRINMWDAKGDTDKGLMFLKHIETFLKVQRQLQSQLEFNVNIMERMLEAQATLIFHEQLIEVIRETINQYPETEKFVTERIADIAIVDTTATTVGGA